jgi:hypothetical protein
MSRILACNKPLDKWNLYAAQIVGVDFHSSPGEARIINMEYGGMNIG